MNLSSEELKKHLGSVNPLLVLKQWLKEAEQIKSLREPWAMTLSTVDKGKISSRIVLLKQVKKDQMIFYTNYQSRKGQALNRNPYAALNFHWPQLKRQICIEGSVTKARRAQSISYWNSRSRNSQISQWISRQSQGISSRAQLEELKKEAEEKFHKKKIPCPAKWGGYILRIRRIEFWKERDYRLHDRFLFEKKAKGWTKQRLFP